MLVTNYKISFLAPKILIILSLAICGGGLYLLSTNTVILLEWSIIRLLATPLNMTFILDPAGLIYRSTVLFISSNVIRFSKFYMADDPFINRFTVLVIIFIASINLLIFIPHFMALLLGWDGLGLTSFILVIYYQNPKSLAAGIITALTNRIGDVIILVAIGLTLNQGHWSITHMWDTPFVIGQLLAITLAACTKRAQIPFSSWLPAAIAAPTPVSALVHSSTLVTAGVFLLIRFYPFLGPYKIFNSVVLFTAVSTMFIAGIRACSECDIKKIIALSTLRQLGVIITRLGLGAPKIALFHIITHALFKALLFICAGELIALHAHGQELRWMGHLNNLAPVASTCITVASIALCGLPYLAGFYSKDLIIEYFLVGGFNSLILLLSLVAVGFTALYSLRLSLVVIWGPRTHRPLFGVNEPKSLSSPILLISSISITCGSFILWLLPIYKSPLIIPISIKLLPLAAVIIGRVVGFILSSTLLTSPRKRIYFHLSNYRSCIIWFLAPISTQPLLRTFIVVRHKTLKFTDQSWLELLGPQGIHSIINLQRTNIQSSLTFTPSSLILCGAVRRILIMSLTYFSCLDSLHKAHHWSWWAGDPSEHCLWCK